MADDDHPWGPIRLPEPGDHSTPCFGVCDHRALSCPTCTTRTPSSWEEFHVMVQDIVTIHDDDHAVRDDQLALLAGRYAAVAFTPRRWQQTRGGAGSRPRG